MEAAQPRVTEREAHELERPVAEFSRRICLIAQIELLASSDKVSILTNGLASAFV